MSLLDNSKATGGKRESIFTDDGNMNASKRRRTSDGDNSMSNASKKRQRCSDSVTRMTDAARKRQRTSDGDHSMSNASKKRQRSSDSVTRMTDESNKRQRTSESHCSKHASTERRKVPSRDGRKQEATSRKKQPFSDKTSGQQASTNKKIPSDFERKTAARMKRPGAAEDSTLRLVLEPSAAPVKLRRKFRGTPLDVHGRTVCGCVNGRDCSFMLDCGSSVNIILFSVAKKLGLLTGQERTMKMKIALWMGPKVLEVIMLDKVAVTLGKKVQIYIPFLVLPETIELYYRKLHNVLLLGIPVLRRLNAVQTFTADESRLYIRLPRRFKAMPVAVASA